MRWRSPRIVALVLLLTLQGPSAMAQEPVDELVTLSVVGSPVVVGKGKRAEAVIDLARPADVRLRVTDFDGRLVRELHDGPLLAGVTRVGWFGRDDEGQRVPSGPYRLVAVATTAGEPEQADAWLTVAERAVYPRAPGYITVAVDPGHGGALSGAVGADGTREADINLDIGLRLTRMLEGAGVNVVITRTEDVFVNTPAEERTGDGAIDDDDELAARPDLANSARADLFLSIHNNNAVNPSVGGPSTFYYDERPFSDRSARLARIVQERMVAALDGAVDGPWRPYDHGALVYPYYVLRGYDPPRLRRPTQMPGVLSEGLFLSNPRELRLLQRPSVRAAMAAGYYEAVASYLAGRGVHLGYRLVSGPTEPVTAGKTVTFVIEVRNQGTEAVRGWRLRADALPAPRRYVSRVRGATSVGAADIPGVRPGRARRVTVEVRAPSTPGAWTVLFDARDRDGQRAAERGIPMLQVPLTTVAAVSPVPSQVPSPSFTPAPSAAASATPSGYVPSARNEGRPRPSKGIA